MEPTEPTEPTWSPWCNQYHPQNGCLHTCLEGPVRARSSVDIVARNIVALKVGRSMPSQGTPARRSGRGCLIWSVIGVLCIAAFVVGGVRTGWYWLERAPKHTATEQRTYAHPIDRIEIELHSGSVDLESGEGGRVAIDRTLTWSDDRPTYREEWQGNVLRITTGCSGRRCSLDYRIQLPAGVAVDAYTSAGNVNSRSMQGDQKLRSDSGDVGAVDASGRLSASSGSGDVIGTGLSSTRTDGKTDSGNLSLKFAKAPEQVIAGSDSGNVSVIVPQVAQGYRVRADTDSGSRDVGVTQSSGSPYAVTAHTDSGNVVVRYA